MGRVPTIEVETAGGTREVSLDALHLKNRNIFITGEINQESANDFLSRFLYLTQESNEPITVYINSPGGEVLSGLLIYDAIVGSNVEVNTVCAGLAASMAAIILSAGTIKHRFILEHSKVMIHEPLIAGGAGGSATSIKTLSDHLLETKRVTNEALAKRTGKSQEEIDEATKEDNYMSAKEAVKFGLCDYVTRSINIVRGA